MRATLATGALGDGQHDLRPRRARSRGRSSRRRPRPSGKVRSMTGDDGPGAHQRRDVGELAGSSGIWGTTTVSRRSGADEPAAAASATPDRSTWRRPVGRPAAGEHQDAAGREQPAQVAQAIRLPTQVEHDVVPLAGARQRPSGCSRRRARRPETGRARRCGAAHTGRPRRPAALADLDGEGPPTPPEAPLTSEPLCRHAQPGRDSRRQNRRGPAGQGHGGGLLEGQRRRAWGPAATRRPTTYSAQTAAVQCRARRGPRRRPRHSLARRRPDRRDDARRRRCRGPARAGPAGRPMRRAIEREAAHQRASRRR